MTVDSIPLEAANLIAQLVGANVSNLASVTDRIIDNLTDRAETAEATVDAMRDQVEALLNGPYIPTPKAIRKAMHPSPETVAEYRKKAEL